MAEIIIETKGCEQCGTTFTITDKDTQFYDKISPVFNNTKYLIPTPTLCPDCRQQRRLSFRNERKLYKRTCDATGKQIISIYSEDKPYKVYDPKIWRSDQRDPMEYGQDYDFTRPFFDQIQELTHKVPVIGLNVMGNENCDYVNCCGYSKNCYLSYNTDYSQDMLYCSNCIKSKDGVDLYKCSQSVGCFDSVDLYNCYNLFYSQFCFDCHNSWYIVNCKGCSDCYGCANLTNQQYCIFNKQYTKDQYLKRVDELKQNSIAQQKQDAQNFLLTQPCMYIKGNNNESCTGNYLFNSKNIQSGFDVGDSQNCKYCGIVNDIYECHDWDHTGYGGNHCYQLSSCGDTIQHTLFSVNIWSGAQNVLYCILNINIKDCFGCVGLRDKQYCILNKQYTKEEYETLVPKIIEHMQKNGERGKFFPAEISPFGYNETIAQEYFPITKTDAIQQGYRWSDYEMPFPQVDKMLQASELPSIETVTDDILQQAILCEVTNKPFRIVKPELQFYRKYHLPLPRKHPDQRHLERMQLRNPRKLFDRACDKCGIAIQTTYAPERPEIVYCEDCYHKEIYG